MLKIYASNTELTVIDSQGAIRRQLAVTGTDRIAPAAEAIAYITEVLSKTEQRPAWKIYLQDDVLFRALFGRIDVSEKGKEAIAIIQDFCKQNRVQIAFIRRFQIHQERLAAYQMQVAAA